MPESKAFTDHEKINVALLKVTCIFWFLAKLIGWRMWTTDRLFPTAPVFEATDRLPSAIHFILFALSLVLIISIFILPEKKQFLWGLLAVEIFSCLLDQNRWQPWEYQYLFIIFIFIVNPASQKYLTAAFAFILAATYIYSGLGKLNDGFLQTIWAKMLLHLFFKIGNHAAMQGPLYYCGYLSGIAELFSGAALFFLRTRKIAAILLIGMHMFILLFLGPFGLRYNIIIWPWNVAMILYLYIIFLRRNPVSIPAKWVFTAWNKLVFICWAILPALNFIGCWDNYLSSGIYSGKLPRLVICIKDTSKCKPVQKFSRTDLINTCNGGAVLDLQYWSMAETKVAPYPEIRVYKKIQAKLEKQFPDAGLSFVYFINGRKQ